MTNHISIPVTRFTRWQVAEILGVSLATVNLYTKRGKRISNDLFVKLNKSGNQYTLDDIKAFQQAINKEHFR
jgi:predicted transcriptional regulator